MGFAVKRNLYLNAFDCVKDVEQPMIMFDAGRDHKFTMSKEVE